MTMEVKPQQKTSMLGKALPVAGAAVGGYLTSGSPQGMAAGAQAGNMVGGFLGTSSTSPNVQTSAMSRRMNSSVPDAPTQQQDPGEQMQALEDARMALAQQSPEMQKQYGPAIQAAMLQQRRQGVV